MTDPGDTPRNALSVIVQELDPIRGLSVLDVGCGAGGLRAALEKAGAIWRGVDPFPTTQTDQIDTAPAQAMPYDDAAFDAAICVNALHHVPGPAMPDALAEIARVLRPGGRLVVIEPKASGPLSQVIALIDDETDIRTAAQAAMDTTTALVQLNAYDYPRIERYADFQAFCDSLTAVAPARGTQITTHRDALNRAFLQHAARNDDGFMLSQPMSLRVFRPAKARHG